MRWERLDEKEMHNCDSPSSFVWCPVECVGWAIANAGDNNRGGNMYCADSEITTDYGVAGDWKMDS